MWSGFERLLALLHISFSNEQHTEDGWGAFVVLAQYSVDCYCACQPYPWQGASVEDLFRGIKRSHHPILLCTIQGQTCQIGTADQRGSGGTGSTLFEINVHIWPFGRPQPQTMSVSDRLAAAEVIAEGGRQQKPKVQRLGL